LRVTPGVQFKPNALISGGASVGYLRFDTLEASVPPFHGAYGSVDLSYTLLGTTRFSVQSVRDVEYSFDPSRPYYLSTGITGSVTQALSGSWAITARAGKQRLNYSETASDVIGGSPPVDTIDLYGARIAYRLSPGIQLGVDADYHRRRAWEPGRDYAGLRAGFFLTYGAAGR
jgi:hypothetical protein